MVHDQKVFDQELEEVWEIALLIQIEANQINLFQEDEDEWVLVEEVEIKIYHEIKVMRRHRARRVRRNIEDDPQFTCFKPAGIPRCNVEKVELLVDEYEAIRLSDLEGLNMKDGSKKMGVSTPTFCRMVDSAHKKIADAIVNGKGIRIYKKNEKFGDPHELF